MIKFILQLFVMTVGVIFLWSCNLQEKKYDLVKSFDLFGDNSVILNNRFNFEIRSGFLNTSRYCFYVYKVKSDALNSLANFKEKFPLFTDFTNQDSGKYSYWLRNWSDSRFDWFETNFIEHLIYEGESHSNKDLGEYVSLLKKNFEGGGCFVAVAQLTNKDFICNSGEAYIYFKNTNLCFVIVNY